MPTDFQGRAQVTRWCFAALASLELPMFQIAMFDLMGPADPTGEQQRPGWVKYAEQVLDALEGWLQERPYVTGEAFTVAVILTVPVLREVRHAGVLAGFPRVSAYRERGEARPPLAAGAGGLREAPRRSRGQRARAHAAVGAEDLAVDPAHRAGQE